MFLSGCCLSEVEVHAHASQVNEREAEEGTNPAPLTERLLASPTVEAGAGERFGPAPVHEQLGRAVSDAASL